MESREGAWALRAAVARDRIFARRRQWKRFSGEVGAPC